MYKGGGGVDDVAVYAFTSPFACVETAAAIWFL